MEYHSLGVVTLWCNNSHLCKLFCHCVHRVEPEFGPQQLEQINRDPRNQVLVVGE